MEEIDKVDFYKFIALIETIDNKSYKINNNKKTNKFNFESIRNIKNMLDEYFSKKNFNFDIRNKIDLLE